MSHQVSSRRKSVHSLAAASAVLLCSRDALAHVKWFSSDVNCNMQPQMLTDLLSSPAFFLQAALFLMIMLLVAFLDRLLARQRSTPAMIVRRVDVATTPWVAPIMRMSVAIFFVVAVLFYGKRPVYLTPELKAFEPWIPAFQLALAGLFAIRATAWLGALGVAVLYGLAIHWYGWFHMMDYPIFLGIAATIAIDSLYSGTRAELGLAVLRFTVGITLMWAGGEKWLYPWWSYPLLQHQLSGALFGLSYDSFMYLCGFVEFCAAYALVFGRGISQVAALFLLLPFVAAIPAFGALDAVGHSPIIVALVLLFLTRSRLPENFLGCPSLCGRVSYAFGSFVGAFFVIGAYWLLHYMAYPQSYRGALDQPVIALLMVIPVLSKLAKGLFQAFEKSHLQQQASW